MVPGLSLLRRIEADDDVSRLTGSSSALGAGIAQTTVWRAKLAGVQSVLLSGAWPALRGGFSLSSLTLRPRGLRS